MKSRILLTKLPISLLPWLQVKLPGDHVSCTSETCEFNVALDTGPDTISGT